MADPWSAAWAEAQACAPADTVELFSLELISAAFVIDGQPFTVRAVNDDRDHVLLLEGSAPFNAGEAVTFTGIRFQMPWPEIEEGRVPELTIRIDNVNREIVPYLDAAVTMGAIVEVIMRVHLWDAKTGATTPGTDPIRYPLRSVRVGEMYVEGVASPADLANLQAMRLVYDLASYPGMGA